MASCRDGTSPPYLRVCWVPVKPIGLDALIRHAPLAKFSSRLPGFR